MSSVHSAGAPAASFDDVVSVLRSAGEPTRLRLLALLSVGEATVKDLTEVLAQSQPRVSRHSQAAHRSRGWWSGLPEGAWAYYRLVDDGGCAAGLTRRGGCWAN